MKVVFIAEAGVNHNGSLKIAKKLINAAKKAAPAIEVKKNSEKKEKSDKSKTVAEIDRDKLEKKFSPKKEMKPN